MSYLAWTYLKEIVYKEGKRVKSICIKSVSEEKIEFLIKKNFDVWNIGEKLKSG